jgi:NitT/TauT family transport system substrate-binding protein
MLKNTTVLGGRAGGTPEMVFEYILKQNKIDPKKDLSINQNIDFGATAAAFSGGQGDFTIEFEPSATALESSGTGYVVASLGVDSGYLPYTAFCAKKSYIEKHPDTIQHFTNALQRGMKYTNSHTPAEIAKVIIHQFPDTDMDTLTTIVSRYYNQETWKKNLILTEKDYDLMLTILDEAGVLDGSAPYDKLVNTDYATNAAK